jgi:hypothetical protein
MDLLFSLLTTLFDIFQKPLKIFKKLVTPSGGARLQKRTLPQLVQKLSTFHITRRFIAVFTRARHLFLSLARLFHPRPPLVFI